MQLFLRFSCVSDDSYCGYFQDTCLLFYLLTNYHAQRRMSCLIHFNLLIGINSCENSSPGDMLLWSIEGWRLCCVL